MYWDQDRKEDRKEAERCFKQANACDTGYGGGWVQLARTAHKNADLKLAVEMYKECLKCEPFNGAAWCVCACRKAPCHLDAGQAPCVSYGVKYIGLVSLVMHESRRGLT